jgi:fused signal recognition particle receptor
MFDFLKKRFNKLKKELDEEVEISTSQKVKSLILEQEIILDERKVSKILGELELILLEGDVALEVVDKISEELKANLVGKKKKIGVRLSNLVEHELIKVLKKLFYSSSFDFYKYIEEREKPVVILFVGVNGTGKTTTIAKVAKKLMDRDHSVVIAAGDTFRAGAIEQIEEHATNLGVKLIKHKAGSDPSAVIYDAIQHARAKKIDIVLADSAGRMHTKKNLLDQLEKIKRINSPDLIVFVDESTAGNDCVERARMFNETVGIDGSILTKLDADPKGGSAISVAYITGKPIIFFGIGQEYDDLIEFDADWLIDRILGKNSD